MIGRLKPGAPYSLRRRLLAFLLVPLSIIGLFAIFDAYRSARETANEVYDRVLSGSALAIAERVFVNDDGELDVDIPYVALEMLTSAAQDRVFYKLETGDGLFITGYERLEVPRPEPSGPARFAFTDTKFRGTNIRMAVHTAFASSGDESIIFRIAVAETTNARDQLAEQILLRSALRYFLLLAATAIIAWVAVTRSLRPLGRLQAAIGRRSSDDLRPIEHHVPDEVRGVVDNLNEFISRLETALGGLKRFTGNASHQLRTPLTIIRTQIALAERAKTQNEIKRALADCDQAVVDAERMLSQLLLLARVDETSSKSLLTEQVDLNEVAKRTTEIFVMPAARADFDLGVESEAEPKVLADETLLRELIGNLIDNAIKHGRGGSEITVQTSLERNQPILRVIDNGPGFSSPPEVDTSRRFGTSNNDNGSHLGLGLTIVKEIADLFGAELLFPKSKTGKETIVEVRFPRTVS